VKQYVGVLLEGFAGNITAIQRDCLYRAYTCNERQLKIIDTLLSVARLDAGKVRVVLRNHDISDLLANILENQRLIFEERDQRVIFKKLSSPVLAYFDKQLLRMAIENLIDNASKYSPKGKSITVSLKRQEKQIQITIRDQGVGISNKAQANLFQKFSRIDNPLSTSVSGSGLGLYWAKKIVDLHNGTIELASRLRQGSTFTIKLPSGETPLKA
jgi:signal transduction histidine kinase